MNSKLVLFFAAAFFGALIVPIAKAENTNGSIIAEVTIEDDGKLARLSVYLINQSKESQTLFTGRVGTSSRGRFDAVDLDMVANKPPSGNGALIVPELTFGAIKLSAPTTVNWGATYRNMRPTLLELPGNERVFYCVFSVPSLYIQSEFLSGRLQFPALSDGGKELTGVEVTVVKCTRK